MRAAFAGPGRGSARCYAGRVMHTGTALRVIDEDDEFDEDEFDEEFEDEDEDDEEPGVEPEELDEELELDDEADDDEEEDDEGAGRTGRYLM